MNIDLTHIGKRTGKVDSTDVTIDTYVLPPFSIFLIGASGTGKSSLLASMHEELVNKHADLSFEPDKSADKGKTFEIINKQLVKLYKDVESRKMGEKFAIPGAIAGNAQQREYHFAGKHMAEGFFHHKEFIYPVKFIDSPGGWFYDPQGTHDNEIQKSFELSQAYIYCIDTPAMVTGQKYHLENNRAIDIQSWFTKAAKNGAFKNKSIVFVLSRSEAYRCKQDLIRTKLEECYGALIRLLKSEGAQVYAVPVYTLGGISFTGEYCDGTPMYVKHGIRKAEDCEIPLIQLLYDCMNTFEQKLHELNQRIKIIISNGLGITHYDLAEECARHIKEQMQPKVNPKIWAL